MKTTETIQQIIHRATTLGTYIPNGLTNNNYIIDYNNVTYVVRVPKENVHTVFDYKLENCILNKIQHLGLDVDTFYYDANTGVKITHFVKGAHHDNSKHLKNVALLLKKLHDASIVTGVRFDIVDKYKTYKKLIKDPLFDLEPFEYAINDVAKISDTWVVCHNDVVEGNLLFTDDRAYLIDYEYACDNDPYFDLMSFITENDIIDENQRKVFLEAYFGRPLSCDEKKKLETFEWGHHILWCTWAMGMYERYQEQVYKDIAILKYKRLLQLVRKNNEKKTQ